MKKLIVASARALLAAPPAWGQYYLPRPVTNPFDRSPFLPPAYPGTALGVPGRFTDAQIVQQLQLLQQQQTQFLTAQGLGPVPPYPQTGHPAYFGNHQQYFFNVNGAGLPMTFGLATTGPLTTGPGFLPQNTSRPGFAPARPATGAPPPGTVR
jgi:hypothetical protein